MRMGSVGRRFGSAVAILTAAVMLSGCGHPEPLRAYDNAGGWTPEFKSYVAAFMQAVHEDDVGALRSMNSSIGSESGLAQLLAAYGGRSLTLVSYDAESPGDGEADLVVDCGGGVRRTFMQPFESIDGHWHATMYSIADVSGRTTPASVEPDQALTEPGSNPDDPLVDKYGLYPPCGT